MRYSIFTVEDFCKDADFIKWAVSPTPDSDRFWRTFMESNPHKTEEVQLALECVRAIQFAEAEPAEDDLLALKRRIWKDVETIRPVVYRRLNWAYLAAASVIFILAAGFWLTLQKSQLTYRTAYGEVREIKLDDGSSVTLNARSEIRITEDIANKKVREVWLLGEAYFKIAKRNGAKFIVHTAETQVEVLGTTFNVNTRRKQTRVVLAEGKVQLLSGNNPALVMKPGDMATIGKDSQVRFKRVQPNHYDSWKESYIVMDDKPVSEIAEAIEDNYGIRLQFQDSSLLAKRLSGKLATKNPEQFLENLSTILERDLIKTGDGYIFR
ncbi:FecR family protein [Dyadobacter sp. CY323]|uniref:FecR family protein n=1 Tax=Dyadobacter sp. CY323 TaxID=2907302 RepID=UPI001F2C80F7|nr:FecR domain-containing protein [Dyadobacter sp. CY323]MCE6992485.1 FecR domain-containing protein [Dyadobacter sp. CY323]